MRKHIPTVRLGILGEYQKVYKEWSTSRRTQPAAAEPLYQRIFKDHRKNWKISSLYSKHLTIMLLAFAAFL
jgi:hypothetical protein